MLTARQEPHVAAWVTDGNAASEALLSDAGFVPVTPTVVPADALGYYRAAGAIGTVMAAAGVPEALNEWVLQDRFEEWLQDCCVPGANDQDPGTVLVWRSTEHLPVHAAVTLGDGWAIEKPAQTWWTPRTVLDVRELIAANRALGQRLERHRLIRK